MATQLTIDGREEEPKALAVPTPMHLIEMAVQKGADAQQLAILMDLQLKWEANEARKQFEAAFQQFKRNAPEILKTKHVSFPTSTGGRTDYWHAELDKITPIITDALLAVGIDATWETSDANGKTTITCILQGFGHIGRKATLSGPADTSGGKNSVQAIGSTVTYLQRYTLLSACGLAAKGSDDDGKTEGMAEDAIFDYCVQMTDCTTLEELRKAFEGARAVAKSAGDMQALERFVKVKDEKKRELKESKQ